METKGHVEMENTPYFKWYKKTFSNTEGLPNRA